MNNLSEEERFQLALAQSTDNLSDEERYQLALSRSLSLAQNRENLPIERKTPKKKSKKKGPSSKGKKPLKKSKSHRTPTQSKSLTYEERLQLAMAHSMENNRRVPDVDPEVIRYYKDYVGRFIHKCSSESIRRDRICNHIDLARYPTDSWFHIPSLADGHCFYHTILKDVYKLRNLLFSRYDFYYQGNAKNRKFYGKNLEAAQHGVHLNEASYAGNGPDEMNEFSKMAICLQKCIAITNGWGWEIFYKDGKSTTRIIEIGDEDLIRPRSDIMQFCGDDIIFIENSMGGKHFDLLMPNI